MPRDFSIESATLSPRNVRHFASWLLAIFGFAVAVGVFGSLAAAQAQAASEPLVLELKGGESSADIARMIEALGQNGRSVTIRMAAAPAAKPADAAASQPPASHSPPVSDVARFMMALDGSFGESWPSLRAIPTLGPDFARAWAAEGVSGVSVWLTIAAALAIALAIGWCARAFAAGLLAGRSHADNSPSSRVALALQGAAVDIAGAIAAVIAFKLMVGWWTPKTSMAAASAVAATRAFAALSLFAIVGRFLLAPGRPEARMLRLPRADTHFRILLGYALLGQCGGVLMTLADRAADHSLAVGGLYLVVNSLFTLFKIWWFWMARHDIANLILSAADDPQKPGLLRCAIARATPWIYIAASVLIWIIARVAVSMPNGAMWAWSAATTQVVILLAPIAAIGVSHLVQALHQRRAGQSESPLRKALIVVGERAAAGMIWLGSLIILAHMWGDFFMESGSSMIVTQLRNLVAVAAVLIVGYLIWTFCVTLFDAHAPKPVATLPGDEDNTHDQVQTRIGSVLPILRGFSLGAIIGLTALIALSKLGVDIGPLLAGFGILGLAISFGSQALVRDIVSGLFFMVEDAFRVGEYIDTGKLRGTVEKISLRSVQLRHQSGQIHTVPFGQIASVTNSSRDWATVKFNIKLDRGVDIEKARKAIKKTGVAMMEDPEVGKDFILPLKMQGVSDITETGIIVRLKFTAKPTQASYLQRESLKRVHRALNEAGVSFASNAVTVMRSMDDLAAAAASVNIAQRAANAPAA